MGSGGTSRFLKKSPHRISAPPGPSPHHQTGTWRAKPQGGRWRQHDGLV